MRPYRKLRLLGWIVSAIIAASSSSGCGKNRGDDNRRTEAMLPPSVESHTDTASNDASVPPTATTGAATATGKNSAVFTVDSFFASLRANLGTPDLPRFSGTAPIECVRGYRLGLIVDERCLQFDLSASN